jgi:hypothetical protein
MPNIEDMTPGQVLADLNVAEFIKNLGLGIAEAQKALDENSLNTALEMARTRPEFTNRSLMNLDFSPTFYHYQYADLEVSLQITMKVEKSEGFHVGFNISGGFSDTNTGSGSGSATITVRVGGGQPAHAVLRLAEASVGEATIGAVTVHLANDDAGGASPNVRIVANSMRQTALAFAARMSDPPEAVPDVLNATVELTVGGTAILPTTNSPFVFAVSNNTIEILGHPATPARALISVTGPGTIQLMGTDAATWTATTNLAQAAATAIDNSTYDAVPLFQGGRALQPPRFRHGIFNQLEGDEDYRRLDTLVAFLRENPNINVRLVGHADQSGGEAGNQTLSERRAAFIRTYLLGQGLTAARIVDVRGEGERSPLPGHEHPGQTGDALRDVENRRVEFTLADPAQQNLVRITTVASGQAQQWGSRPTLTGGMVLSSAPGSDAVDFSSAHIAVSGHNLYALAVPASNPATPNSTWAPGLTIEDSARALAAAILANAHVDAYAEGRFVRLLPVGSSATITLESQARNLLANTITLTTPATGSSLSRVSGFSGATEAGEANPGDTVTVGTSVLTCVSANTTPTNRQFQKGADPAATARNLQAAIGALSGMTATVDGAVITVRGPGGTRLETSNTGAFQLSAATLSGTAAGSDLQRTERNISVAAGFAIDHTTARKYNLDVTGNSRIAARLVSLPAPIELLDEIRRFLNGNPSTNTNTTPAPVPTPPLPSPSPGGNP